MMAAETLKERRPNMAGAWTMSEYEHLFRDHPPTEPHAPAGDGLERLADAFERSPKAVHAQWDDARSAVLHDPPPTARVPPAPRLAGLPTIHRHMPMPSRRPVCPALGFRSPVTPNPRA